MQHRAPVFRTTAYLKYRESCAATLVKRCVALLWGCFSIQECLERCFGDKVHLLFFYATLLKLSRCYPSETLNALYSTNATVPLGALDRVMGKGANHYQRVYKYPVRSSARAATSVFCSSLPFSWVGILCSGGRDGFPYLATELLAEFQQNTTVVGL